jgi:hypothetical protein
MTSDSNAAFNIIVAFIYLFDCPADVITRDLASITPIEFQGTLCNLVIHTVGPNPDPHRLH